jgi:hypothetical protein
MKSNKIFSVFIPLLIIGFYFYQRLELHEVVESANSIKISSNDNHRLNQIIEKKNSGTILTLKGHVFKVLKDDIIGSRHQKLIIKVGRHTLLLAHNIDIAERIPIKKGDILEVRGEYQWNNQGGLIHWTHADRANHHEGGWIKHKNKIYQ